MDDFHAYNKQMTQLKSKGLLGITVTLIAFICFIPMGVSAGPFGAFLMAIPFMGGAIYAGMQQKKLKALSNQFKEKYLMPELKKIIPNATYRLHDGFLEQEVIYSRLLKNQDRFKSEDLIEGIIDGIKFRCSDIHQQDVRSNSKGGSSTVTIFKGRFYEIDLIKPLNADIVIMQKQIFKLFKHDDLIETESIRFNQELTVYANGQVEALRLLKPKFMEKLLYLDQRFNDKISFSFIKNKMYIAINHGKDTFDFSPNHKVDENFINAYKEEFINIKAFIKMLIQS